MTHSQNLTTLSPSELKTRRTDTLLAIYIAAVVAAELLGSKIFTGFGINASVGIFAFPLTFTINDIITEVHGKKRALSFVRAGFVTLVALFGYVTLATLLPPAERFVPTNPAYLEVFSKSQRIIVASITAFFLAERLDVLVFSKIRQKLGQKSLWLRNNVSNFVSQFFDTTIFMFLAFYSPGNFWFIWSLIIPYWLLKCGASIVETPFVYWGVSWLKGEGKQ